METIKIKYMKIFNVLFGGLLLMSFKGATDAQPAEGRSA